MQKALACTFILAVTAVAATRIEEAVLPYCKQNCMRRWNLSTHIQRKHPGQFNPILELKRLGLIESHSCALHRPPNRGAGFYKSAPTDSGAGFYKSAPTDSGAGFSTQIYQKITFLT